MNSAQLLFAALAWDLKKSGNSRLAEAMRQLSADDARALLESILRGQTKES